MGSFVQSALVVCAFHGIYLIVPALMIVGPIYWLYSAYSAQESILWPVLLIVAYLITYLDGSEHQTGRPWRGLVNLNIMRMAFDWFPMCIQKPPVPLDAGRQYIFGFHPHGALAFSRGLVSFATDVHWEKAFPGIERRDLAASVCFKIPFIRELWLASYCVDARKKTALKVLKKKLSIGVYPGGMAEQIRFRQGHHEIYILKRKGFVKLALQTGTPLVPTYFFGEADMFTHHQFMIKARMWLVKKFGMCIPLVTGSFGLMPHQTPVTMVSAPPLELPTLPNPTAAELDHWHAAYCTALRTLFDAKKGEFPRYANAELVMV